MTEPRKPSPPILNHPLDAPTVFRAEDLVDSVRSSRNRTAGCIPEICILEFDGDLTDKLRAGGKLEPCDAWPCFHTTLWQWASGGISCGIIPRTIGGSYTVLIAEQLAVCGVKLIIGLASAGRLNPTLPLPSIVLANEAIRDEGTSYHYLPPGDTVKGTQGVLQDLEHALGKLDLPLRSGLVWTTDAPYRETEEQMKRHADRGALAVEMQAASLFAFGSRKNTAVALVAHLTNAPDHDGEAFSKGSEDIDIAILEALCQGGAAWLNSKEKT